MLLKLRRETRQIKSGWCARSTTLGLAAHGGNPEVADMNLERTIRLFLMPFQREGTLEHESRTLGLGEISSLDDIEIALE